MPRQVEETITIFFRAKIKFHKMGLGMLLTGSLLLTIEKTMMKQRESEVYNGDNRINNLEAVAKMEDQLALKLMLNSIMSMPHANG